MTSRGIFITGTDTGVGKTIVASAIARFLSRRGLSVGVLKPVTSGAGMRDGHRFSQDAELLAWAAGCTDPAEFISPYVLRDPLAPSEAAALEGVTIEAGRILESFNRLAACHDYVVVEGAGGLLVPLAEGLLVADLPISLQLPVIIVARSALGTINHTLMTCECARSRGIRVLGIIVNNQPVPTGIADKYVPSLMERLSGLPVLATFQANESGDEKAIVGRLAEILWKQPLADLLAQEVRI